MTALAQHFERRRRLMARATTGRCAAGPSFHAVLTQREVGLILGMRQSTVRDIEVRAITKLRRLLGEAWLQAVE